MMEGIYGSPAPGKDLRGLTVLTVGGDARMTAAARALSDAGAAVRTVGLGPEAAGGEDREGSGAVGARGAGNVRAYRTLTRAAEGLTGGAGAVILPLPVTRDGTRVWCPLDGDCVVTSDALTALCAACRTGGGLHVVGGMIPQAWREGMEAAGARVTELTADENFLARNASLTAEGALMLMMEQTDKALSDTSAAVLGYGRVGRALGRLLTSVGVSVTVCARRAESRARAQADGCAARGLTEADALDVLSLRGEGCYPQGAPAGAGCDAVFNTVPARLLTGRLDALRPASGGRGPAPGGRPLYIELASPPGIADPVSLRGAGVRVVCAPSLPVRYAPASAGAAYADAVLAALTTGGETV